MTIALIVFIAFALLCFLVYAYAVWLQVRYPTPSFATEVHRIVTSDGWTISLHRRMPDGEPGDPILLCHGLSANHFNFEFPHGDSLVDVLVEAGYDCWSVDLRTCRTATPPPGRNWRDPSVDDYLDKDLPAAVQFILDKTGCAKLHWVGHSMGGMLLYAYELRFGNSQLACAATLGSPIGFEGVRHTSVPIFCSLLGILRGPLSWIILAGAPWDLGWRPRVSVFPVNWKNVDRRISVMSIVQCLDLPTTGVARQMDGWASTQTWTMFNGSFDVKANLSKIQTPLFAVFARHDPFVPLKYAEAFFNALPNPDKQTVVLAKANGYSNDYQHVDLAFATLGRTEVYEPIVEWFSKHPIRKAIAKGNGELRSVKKRATKAVKPKSKVKAKSAKKK